ncbi:uroporphyrinogen decarboxylase [Oribacterium sp. KHPX15]|uniref:uroporphyrinogen decarboxylase family protein n=1 Tax=Oribacterium sp. KHPX15 TaxID=1855342 RepID=UPI00089989D3|nr:uroporphyrinogen decarboxylase family protein [Oribacterium sp. KHPX15]SEA72220.1 uroporphyrinogen decarboxylase [Oribacterium sp. KHPX15]
MSTKRELVLKTFHNEEVERIPVGFWHHYLDESEFVSGVEHPENFKRILEGARKFKEEFDPDFVKIMTDGYFYLPLKLDAKTPETLPDFTPVSEAHPWFTDQEKLAKGYREIYGQDILLFYNIFAPLSHLRFALANGHDLSEQEANDLILHFLKTDPEAVEEALDKIADNIIDLLPYIINSEGADGIYLSVTDTHRFIPDALYRLYVTPSEKKILEAANRLTETNILHICGWRGNTNYITLYQDYPALVFNWAVHTESLSLREGRRFFGGKAVIGGFLNTEESILYRGNKAEIQNETRSIIEETGRTGLIIGADCTVPNDTPVEHLNWVREAAAEKTAKVHTVNTLRDARSFTNLKASV